MVAESLVVAMPKALFTTALMTNDVEFAKGTL
jgi:hypothetical protein